MKNQVLLVPGLMGSSLQYTYQNQVIDVWNDTRDIFYTLIQPQRLQYLDYQKTKDLTVKGIIGFLSPLISIIPGIRIAYLTKYVKIYQDLLNYLAMKGYSKGVDLFVWPYDWRKSIKDLAPLLANEINTILGNTILEKIIQREKILEHEKLIILSHSLGSLIVRYCINAGILKDSSEKIAKLIEMGPPVRGASKAFFSVSTMPAIARSFLKLIRQIPILGSFAFNNLQRVISSFPSIFEMLPPDDEQILQGNRGSNYSAFNWPGWGHPKWPSYISKYISEAQQIKQNLHPPSGFDVRTLYSEDFDTEYTYSFTETPPYRLTQTLQYEDGDDTVIKNSAIPDGIVKAVKVSGSHLQLVNLQRTHNELDKLL